MKKIIVLLLAIIGLVTFETEAQRRPVKYVAVYVEGSSDLDDINRTVISSTFVTALSLSDDYQPIERTEEFERASQKEGDYQLENVRDKEIAKLAGEKFGADYLALITVQEKRREMFIAAKLIDAETGSVIRSCNEIGYPQSLQELRDLAKEAARKLVGSSSRYTSSSSTNSNNSSSQNYGIYDTQVVLNNYSKYKEAERRMEQANQKCQREYAQLENEFNDLYNYFQTLSEYDSNRDYVMERLQSKSKEIEQYQQMASQDLQRLQEQLMTPIQKNVMSCLESISASKNMIIYGKEQTPIGVRGTDITQLIIDKLNREYAY